MADPNEEEEEARGKVDAASVLYIAGGIPAIWGFLVVLFGLAKLFGLPA
jgi:hypothetical protein